MGRIYNPRRQIKSRHRRSGGTMSLKEFARRLAENGNPAATHWLEGKRKR